jgi:hypothetical protein
VAKPKGLTQYQLAVQRNREAVLGRLLVFDPGTGATSGTGWAEYVGGVLQRSGVLTPPRTPLPKRLAWLMGVVEDLHLTYPTCCVIERLRGSRVHPHLHWASGVLITAAQPEVVLEIPIPIWKSYSAVDPAYQKGDLADALAMGSATLDLANGLGAWGGAPQVSGRRAPKRK